MQRTLRKRGNAIMTAVIFFTAITLAVSIGGSTPALKAIMTARLLGNSNQSFFAAESLAHDVFSRLDRGLTVEANESLIIGNATVEAVLSGSGTDQVLTAVADSKNAIRSVSLALINGSGVAFFYGVQAGVGGINMTNTSLVVGNVYSNGPVTGSNSNLVQGTVASAGPSGLIDGVHATSSAYANTIRNSLIEGDAYYQTISNTTVYGTLYSGSADQATSSMPIPDEKIEEWKAEAVAGGTYSSPCPLTINADITLGPEKIECDVNISGSAVVTLDGPVWVVGDVSISNTVDVKVNPSYGNSSVAIIADDPSDPNNSGRFSLTNSSEFIGSGPNSYVLLISMNRAASNNLSTLAVDLSNTAQGDLLLYAPYGQIRLSNNVRLKEVTAYKLSLSNSAQVVYETGLANLIFTSGPGGGYSINSWQEVE